MVSGKLFYNIKYLVLVIDCFLSLRDHIDHISSKISKSVNIIAKLKRHLTTQSLVSIYYALVRLHSVGVIYLRSSSITIGKATKQSCKRY